MFDFLAGVLAELYKLWPSYGGAIILFTALIMLVLSPLSIKSTRSMIAMQRVGPEVKKLQAKYKGDREALNREMMVFYKEHNINPFSSCLPLLLQIPVFIVLYQVLIGLTRRVDPNDATSMFNPKYLEGEDTPLAVALRGTNEMVSFGMDLSQSALSELRNASLLVALPFVVLVGLVVVTSIIQQRQVQGRNPSATVNPQQQMIAKVLPFIFIPISVSIPAGVVIYFVVSNLVRIGQQALVTRLDYKDAPLLEGDDGDGKSGGGKTGGGKKSLPRPSDGGKGGRNGAKNVRASRGKSGAAGDPKEAKAGTKAKAQAPSKAAQAKAAQSKAAQAKAAQSRARTKAGAAAGAKETPTKGAAARASASTKANGGKSATGKAGSPGTTGARGSRVRPGKPSAEGQVSDDSANASSNGASINGSSPDGSGGTSPPPRPRKRKRKRR